MREKEKKRRKERKRKKEREREKEREERDRAALGRRLLVFSRADRRSFRNLNSARHP